jgi:hypothetical protein
MKKCRECNIELILGKNIPASRWKKYDWKCKKCFSSYTREYKSENKEKLTEYQKKWYQDNREYNIQVATKYKQDNLEKYKQYQKEYQKNNKDKFLKYACNYAKTPNGKAKARIRSILDYHLKNIKQEKTNTTSKLLGYNGKILREHLDKQGMDWDFHQIDHKVPITWFKKDTPINLVHDLRNLHPLSPQENREKKNFYSHPIPIEYYNEVFPWIKKEYINLLEIQN